MTKHYGKVYYSNILMDNISVYLVKELLRQDMENQIWMTISSKLAIKPDYTNNWIEKELDLDDDEITITITSKKGKSISFTKKLEIFNPTTDDLDKWDKTHSQKYISRMVDPPADEVGGNTGILR